MNKQLELEGGESFGEHVCGHLSGRAISDLKRAVLDLLMNKMIVDVDVFGASMELTEFGMHAARRGQSRSARVASTLPHASWMAGSSTRHQEPRESLGEQFQSSLQSLLRYYSAKSQCSLLAEAL